MKIFKSFRFILLYFPLLGVFISQCKLHAPVQSTPNSIPPISYSHDSLKFDIDLDLNFKQACYLWKLDTFGCLGLRYALSTTDFVKHLIGMSKDEVIENIGTPIKMFEHEGEGGNWWQCEKLIYSLDKGVCEAIGDLDLTIENIYEYSGHDLELCLDSQGIVKAYYFTLS